MGGHITRRAALIGSVLAIPALSLRFKSTEAAPASRVDLAAAFKTLEEKTGARLGVSARDTGSDNRIDYRENERFAMCSTFKFLAAAAVLARVDQKQEQLERMILIKKSDLVTYSPVTEKYVGKGMSIEAICEAAVTLSDNTAGNLMLDTLGGPKALTKYARSLGDATFRLDRWETELNEAKPGDPRDTITPAAILKDLQKTMLEDALSRSSRDQLVEWMLGSKTGDKRLRAGLPKDWNVGDKTGTSDSGMANDLAVIWPPDRKPILLAVYLYDPKGTADSRNEIHKKVASLVAENI
ncbi:class A beta-lactamase [Phyllobacterium zundukense]|uniref:Beta-lactamase n=1 Tax=Phyllobacterium zundukense TaxID=1867719 RepID=A0A2N9VQX4_9HYPH|nr:class A beta-lactamase [Phyllobacterium zundukense]ATU92327.1 class A beta-lactamase [Phyllobacterium zundukense]PIO41892.1 class A beta-lactamase [Phyllobacterium zundukense]